MGKSTFISNFRNALIIDCDDGHKALENERVTVRSWADIEQVYSLLAQSRQTGELRYTQVVIDTVTMFYRLAQEAFCSERGINHENEVDYKGYDMVRGMMMNMVTKFRNLGLGIVFVSHSQEYFVDKLRKKKDEAGKWVPKMDRELFDYLDSIASISMYFQATDMGDRIERTIHMAPSSMWYAKNRYERDEDGHQILPPSIPMDFNVFRKHVNDYINYRKTKAEEAKKESQ